MTPDIAGLGPAYAAQFDDPSVVEAYDTRPPYPEPLLDWMLAASGTSSPRLVELGCGTGELARRLAPRTSQVTAIDRSSRMIARAGSCPGGDAPNISWLTGEVEDAPIAGTYDLAVAAESFHWFDWPRACERMRAWVPAGALVIVDGRYEMESAWRHDLQQLIGQFSTNREFQPYDLVDELTARGHMTVTERVRFTESHTQSIDAHVTSIHSRNGFSRDRMTPGAARAFDLAVRTLVTPSARNGRLTLTIETRAVRAEVARSRAAWSHASDHLYYDSSAHRQSAVT